MATLLNNQGLQHYANKMVLADNRKVNGKPLPSALQDIDTLIDQMKTLYDNEYGEPVTLELENDSNIFSVGTGTGIDKKEEVENSFSDIGVSGNSLVNLIIRSTDKDAILTNPSRSKIIGEDSLLKPNTKYTILVDVTSLNLDGLDSLRIAIQISKFSMSGTEIFKVNKLGRYIGTITTGEIDENADSLSGSIAIKGYKEQWEQTSTTTRTVVFKNCQILEGDYTNKPLPQYFEGIKSVGQKDDEQHKISILSTGKNLVNKDNIETENGTTIIFKNVILKKGMPLRFFFKTQGKLSHCSVYLRSSKSSLQQYYSVTTFDGYCLCRLGDIINDDIYDKVVIYSTDKTIDKMSDFMFYYGNEKLISCEPYKSNKKEILINEPLRGLPNGIKDTIEKVNGEWKIVRRCGEIVLNGSESWHLWSNYGLNWAEDRSVVSFCMILPKANGTKSTDVMCDNFTNVTENASILENHVYYTKDREIIHCYYSNASTTKRLSISIKKNKLSATQDNWGDIIKIFNQWLSQNPTTVIYELETPVIEDIEPVTLQTWKNGTISIDEVLPVETTHTVALNKSQQILRNIEELTGLRDRVQTLENKYDEIALEQTHQLELINHSIKLDYDI